MKNDILNLAKKFISLESVSKNPKDLEKILELALANLQGHTIERFENNGVKSALIYNSPKRPKRFRIILNGHLDVIPGKKYQYVPRIKGNKLYGVGSMDMKANVACLIMVFKEMADKVDYPLGLQLVTDEEIGGFNGTKYQIEKGIRGEFVIAGEPTNFDIVNKAKGILWIKVSASGKSAHGAYPWRGENAIWKMNEFLEVLRNKFPIPVKEKWITTVNLSTIATSNKTLNKIPDDCIAELDIRYISKDANKTLGDIKRILPKGFKLNILSKEPSLFTEANNKYLKILHKISKQITRKKVSLRVAHGSSDVRHFAKVGCSGVEFGPIGGGIGSDNEWVDIDGLEEYCHLLKQFLKSIK